jgi:deoxyribodipyrimidine photolyase
MKTLLILTLMIISFSSKDNLHSTFPSETYLAAGSDAEQLDELLSFAKVYSDTWHKFMDTEACNKEFNLKRQLRAKYLTCNASEDEILAQISYLGKRIIRKVNEWEEKINLRMLERSSPLTSIEEFETLSKEYLAAYEKAIESEAHKKFASARENYRASAIKVLQKGHATAQIEDALRLTGIEDERTLGQINYWNVKYINR